MTKKTEKKKVTPRKKGARKMRVEISAGGIVFKRTPRGVRIALILDPFGKWAFAKGHVEKGETIEEAAIRETKEEMGLGTLKIIAPLGVIDFWFRDRYRPTSRGVLVHKYVHYFLMETKPRAKGRPQKKEKIRELVWVSRGQAMKKSSYKDVKPILKKVEEHFRKEVKRKPVPKKGKRPAAQPRRKKV